MHSLYAHFRKSDDRIFYIGQSISKNRPYSKRGRNYLWNIIERKNGFYCVILISDLSKSDVDFWERFYISLYGKIIDGGLLCNMTDGGDGSHGINMSEETRNKMSESHKGERNAMFGKTHSASARDKISRIHKGKKLTKEHVDFIKKMNTGRIASPEEREKIRKRMLGRKQPQSVIDAIIKARSKPIVSVKDCSIIEFSSIKKAAEYIKIDRSTLSDYINNEKTYKGYKFYSL